MSELVLFCGGASIYPIEKPKPLTLMPNTLTLIETYLSLTPLKQISQVTLIAESDFFNEIEEVAGMFNDESNQFRVLLTPNHSSTLSKLQYFLSSNISKSPNLLFSYPDVFYFGNWERLFTQDKMMISGVYLQTRFPEINFNPYTSKIHSLNLKPPRVPANSSTIYAGHFSGKLQDIAGALRLFDETRSNILNPTLEGEFFRFLVSQGSLTVNILDGTWIKADSDKERLAIVNLLKRQNGE